MTENSDAKSTLDAARSRLDKAVARLDAAVAGQEGMRAMAADYARLKAVNDTVSGRLDSVIDRIRGVLSE